MNQRPQKHRRGAVLVAVVVCLTVATMMCVSLLKVAGMERKLVGAREGRSQARWLAEAGLERAAARLWADPGYAGETWQLAAEELGGRGAALVTIRVETVPAAADRRLVNVRADYPTGSVRRVRQSRRLTIELRAAGDET